MCETSPLSLATACAVLPATPQQTVKALAAKTSAVLVDVRTEEECQQEGIPYAENDKMLPVPHYQHLPLRLKPDYRYNPEFAAELTRLIASNSDTTEYYFLCRAGIRSQEAAEMALKLGALYCHNIAHGSHGENGWIANNLAWGKVA